MAQFVIIKMLGYFLNVKQGYDSYSSFYVYIVDFWHDSMWSFMTLFHLFSLTISVFI